MGPRANHVTALGLALCALSFGSSAPANAQSPTLQWQGFYAGVTAGGTWNENDTTTLSTTSTDFNPVQPSAAIFAADYAALSSGPFSSGTGSGVIAGGKVGFNWQFDSGLVAGIEADLQALSGDADRSTNGLGQLGFVTTSTITVSKSVDYLGTLRGRLGWLVTPSVLVYGTAGLAYGGVESGLLVAQDSPIVELLPAQAVSKASETLFGWTAGGGGEWLIGSNWSLNGEYLYYDLGTQRFNGGTIAPMVGAGAAGAGSPLFVNHLQASTRFDGHIIRVGASYHFDWRR